MSDIKNAFDYHKELSELVALITSIDSSLAEVEAAFDCITDDPSGAVSIGLSVAQRDLRASRAKLKDRHDAIVRKLSASYF